MTRIIGLIGGFSWRTTALYYEEINRHVGLRLGGIHSANLLLRSLDYDDVARTITTGDFNGMARLFCTAGTGLKAAGAQSLVLCANVAHKAADELENTTGLPVLHIVDFTGRKIVAGNFRKVGLLATRSVMEESFYKARLKDKFGLEVFTPGSEFRAKADHDIFHEMSKPLIPDNVQSSWKAAYSRLVQDHGVDCVILGCTELRLIFGSKEMPVPSFETTALHAEGIAEWALQSQSS